MMDTQAVADAVLAWARETCEELQGGYAYPHGRKDQPLPDAAAEIQSTRTTLADPDFSQLSIEQVILRVHEVNLMLVVESEPGDEATQKLNGFVDLLTIALFNDNSLGDRVPGVSPITNTTYDPPFVEFDDGTRGRLATMTLTVGDPIDPEDY